MRAKSLWVEQWSQQRSVKELPRTRILPLSFLHASSPCLHATRLYAVRTALFLLLALCHDGGAEAGPQVFGQFVELGVAVDLNRLLGCIANHVAAMAPGEMVLQFALGLLVENTVQIVRQLLQKLSAFHWMPSPLSRF